MLLSLCLAALLAPQGVSDYDLVWRTPGGDAAGSIPMGNGEVGANVWIEANGDLVLLLARNDTHSEASRLLKPGQVRVSFDPQPSGDFLQRLNLLEGRLEVVWGDLEFEVFAEVDAPHFRIAGRSATPRTVRVMLESWRTQDRTLSGEELKSSWTMRDAPESVQISEAADILELGLKTAALLRVNRSSVVDFTLEQQGIETLAEQCDDPMLGLVSGVWVAGEGFLRDAEGLMRNLVGEFAVTIRSPQPKKCPTMEALGEYAEQETRSIHEADEAAVVRRATADTWKDFWLRSWIFVQGDSESSFRLPEHKNGPPRLGHDSNEQHRWEGEFARAQIFTTALSPEDFRALSANRPDALVSEVEMQWESHVIPPAPPPFITLEAWLRRPPSGRPARIMDWITAGGSDGFLFDTHPGNDLRFIVGTRTLIAPGAWPDDGAWHHVAATYDETNGAMSIWRDGERVAASPYSDPAPLSRVTQAYVLQRWVTACQGRGSFPIKFNGGLFTVAPKYAGGPDFDADWRRWGDCFWWQNTRLPYYPMLAAGDWDLMTPLFDFYARVMPLCRARAKFYYGAEGVYFPETMTPFGTYSNGDYGWDRQGHQPSEVLCPWWQWEWNQGLELVDLMLLHHAYSGDDEFARAQLLPMAREVLLYFDSRFPRDAQGKLRITPTQALETHWHGVVNDMPCVAGLHSVLPRLRALPEAWTTADERALWERLTAALPPYPLRTEDGQTLLAPAEEYDPSRQNVETPELYAIFPFRTLDWSAPALRKIARATFLQRHDKQTHGWTQDGVFAARLGLVEEARENLLAKVRNSHPNFRFPAMWGPNFDWIPDQCHGGNLMLLTQEMLLQSDGERILLFPAWPRDWDVDFKLHAPRGTVVEASLLDGKLVHLVVTPESRRADLQILLD